MPLNEAAATVNDLESAHAQCVDMVELQVPESPLLHGTYPSPELRGEATFGSSSRRDYYSAPILPSVLAEFTAETLDVRLREAIAAPDTSNHVRTALILRHALTWAIRHADLHVLDYLLRLKGGFAELLDAEVAVMEDEEGWGVVGMALEATCGRQDKEEAVRAIVGRWGVDAGPRGGRDRTGWSPLHLAALLSSPPLVSFLLTRGASADAQTNRGLVPLDLVADMAGREDVAILLLGASTGAQGCPTDCFSPLELSEGRAAILQKRRETIKLRALQEEAIGKQLTVATRQENWIRNVVRPIGADMSLLVEPPLRRRSWCNDTALLDEEVDDVEEDEGLCSNDPMDTYEHMLVYSPTRLAAILDVFISSFRPCSQPVSSRTLPANAIYLYARFALHRCDEVWLEELLEGAVEKMEQEIYDNAEDLAFLAFWMYNANVLLYLLLSEETMATTCDELGVIGMLEELINAIHVFIIRVAEKKIDSVLDEALLEYEPLETFDDVRFEGEWALFRSFGAKKQKASALRKKASQVFSGGSAHTSGPTSEESSPGLFNSLREKVEANTPFKVPLTPVRQARNGQTAGMTSSTPKSLRGKKEVESPKSITDILSAVLLVLQLYDINPAITVQVFSQIFFWIACEVFNRIPSRKKYLCRSKAVQIRMNITALDDWVRLNGLPLQTASKHFEPLVQLLQWLQCQSGLADFDDLVSTMQNMKSINPLQMRRAVRDYRYEVNEGRMTEECGQYLAQLQNDWERRRLQASIHAVRKEAQKRNEAPDADSSFASETSFTEEPDEGTPIDALFDGTTALSDFVPPSAPESLGELLDSRFMLPFSLPTDNEFLVAVPPQGTAFANMPAGGSGSFAAGNGNGGSRPASRSSFSASRPMGWRLLPPGEIRQLPGDFFSWLRAAETSRWVESTANSAYLDRQWTSLARRETGADNNAQKSAPDDTYPLRRGSFDGSDSDRSYEDTEDPFGRVIKAVVPGRDKCVADHGSVRSERGEAALPLSSIDAFARPSIISADSFYTPPSPSGSSPRASASAFVDTLSHDGSPAHSSSFSAHTPCDLAGLSHGGPSDVASSPTTPQHTSPQSDGSPTASKRRWWSIGGRAGSEDSTSDVSDILR